MKRVFSMLVALCLLVGLLPMNAMAAEVASGTYGDNLTWVVTDDGTLTISGEGPMKETEFIETDKGSDPVLPWEDHMDVVTKLVIEEGVTTIGDWVFYECNNIIEVSLPSTLTSIGALAFLSTGLKELVIPDSVTFLGNHCFSDLDNLTYVKLPAGLVTAERWTFYDSNRLTQNGIDMPLMPNLDGGLRDMFDDCNRITDLDYYTQPVLESISHMYGLRSITVPDCVETVAEGGIWACTNLERVTFGSGLKTLESNIFMSCRNVKELIFTGDAPALASVDAVPFGNSTDGVCATGYYPAGNPTWTEEVMASYGGSIEWVAYDPANPPAEPQPEPIVFTDVPSGSYYANAVDWAVENGITAGTTDTTFSPNATCTRAQIVSFLWRVYSKRQSDSGLNPFSDVSFDAYYCDAVCWASEERIVAGTSDTTFSPDASCTRAQVATFLWRAAGQPAPTIDNPFTDVSESAFYYDAVLWAAENGITAGTAADTFSPNATCTRAQIVTFLYRMFAE